MKNFLIVLKGMPLADGRLIDLPSIAKNKIGYFFEEIVRAERKLVSFEEFLMLKEFILSQYERVVIVRNNACSQKYPLEKYFSDEVLSGLLTHFGDSEDEDDDRPIGSIDEIIRLYSGVELVDGQLFGSYCELGLNDPKIVSIDLFDEATARSLRSSVEPKDISDRSDELEAVDENLFEHRDEYNALLKKYWRFDAFIDFTIYDMNALADGRKQTRSISQERIISDLVEQVEACGSSEGAPRDLFVTAPTGAGKSAIFQIAAMYLAERYGLFTIVISPLVALMNDMVGGLKLKNYSAVERITGETSQVERERIMSDIAEGRCHMLFVAPELLLARSSVEQLIGERTIGMIVIDEAHIVTTWGKQFRPDYWFLGAHIAKLRKRQTRSKNRSFILAAFTATAIFGGVEDMYSETRDSLEMIDPITYLGCIRRNDLEIRIDRTALDGGEHLLKKFTQLEKMITRARLLDEKMLIYFPTITLIDQFYDYLVSKREASCAVRYYGPLDKERKRIAYESFKATPRPLERPIMLATKAFGMGIDIGDIKRIVHFAPTGGVCDYVQEIGRAARAPGLDGEAIYFYDRRDFKFINRLHGLSCIKKYQIVEIIKKIYEFHCRSMNADRGSLVTRKRNSMLLDAENFTYLFNGPRGADDDNAVNKVKTALLLFQKDFEAKISFPPLVVRPVPMFSIGFFEIDARTQKKLRADFPNCLVEVNRSKKICRVKLDGIWSKDYRDVSFPRFKYYLYSRSREFEFNLKYSVTPALSVEIKLSAECRAKFQLAWSRLKKIVFDGIRRGSQLTFEEISSRIAESLSIDKYAAQARCEVFLASLAAYESLKRTIVAAPRPKSLNSIQYQFKVGIKNYFNWIERLFARILDELGADEEIYIVNNSDDDIREYTTALGVLESLGVLTFKMLGGAGSQLYIYINQARHLKEVIDNPEGYRNRLMDSIAARHALNVKMLTYIYENDFDNARVWDIIEDYFLGRIPSEVRADSD